MNFSATAAASYLLLAALMAAKTQAFCQQQQLPSIETLASSSTKLWSTPPSKEGGNLDDDEISKLIGKRGQIKRKKKEEIEEEKTPDDVVPFDLDSIPEFKTKRPTPKRRQKQEEEKKKEEAASKGSDDLVAVDYFADYDDENDFHIPNRLGFSTRGWGEPTEGFVGEGKLSKRMVKAGKYVPGDLQQVYNKLLEGGISLVETSSLYGKASRPKKLSAEEILAQCVAEYDLDANQPLIVNTLPPSWLPPRSTAMKKTLEGSCQRLNLDLVDVVQASKKLPLVSRFLANGLMQCMEAGSCNYVGVVGIMQRNSLKRLADAVENQGGILTSNAFEFSLTKNKNEYMIDHCKELGVVPLILNPLDRGLASGVYTATNPSGGEALGMAKFDFKTLEKLQPLHSVMETVTERVRTRVSRELRDLQDRTRSRYGPPVRYYLLLRGNIVML